MNTQPTPYPEVNSLVQELLASIRGILGSRLVGMYLDGSLANGGFDQDSDIDFVVVTEEEVTEDIFLELQAMHARIAAIDSIFAIQLEGSYISRAALRRYDPNHALHPNIERGPGEHLKMADHAEPWAVHRYVLREHGITLVGPPPETLIDPVTPDELRAAMRVLLHGWAAHFLDHPEKLVGRGYQSYVVLSLCRLLFTLQSGEVVSKPQALSWAKESLGEKWSGLIDRAWIGRHHSEMPTEAADVAQTLDFVRHTLDRGR